MEPAPLAVQPAQEAQGRITGTIRQGTIGAALPSPLDVGLVGFEDSLVVMEATTQSGAEGNFEFSGLEIAPGRLYGVYVTYQGVSYFSPGVELAEGNDPPDLEVVIYETDPSGDVVRVEQVHFLVDVDSQQRLAITQIWMFSNSGDRTFTPASDSDLRIDLPDYSVETSVEPLIEGDVVDLGHAIAVRAPIRPGQELSVVALTTLELGADEFRMELLKGVDRVVWLVPEDSLTVSGVGVREVGQVEYEGVRLRQYQQEGFQAGDELSVTLKAPREERDVIFMIVMVGALLVVAGAVLWTWNKRRLNAVDPVYELLVRTIAELDQAYEEGRIPAEEHQRRRTILREQALKRMTDVHD